MTSRFKKQFSEAMEGTYSDTAHRERMEKILRLDGLHHDVSREYLEKILKKAPQQTL